VTAQLATAAHVAPPSYDLPRSVRGGSLGVAAAALVLFPLVFSNPTLTTVGVFAMIYLMSVTGWNIFSGYSGYIALGHAVFFGIGQYATAMLASYWSVQPGWATFALLPVAAVLAGLAAIPIGRVLLRVRKHTFIVLTIALMFIFQLFAYNLNSWTGGSQGLQLLQPNWSGDFFNLPFYYVGLGVSAVALATSWWVRRSKFGLGLLAIRDDEDRARSLGIDTTRTKLVAFVISAVFVGAAGAIYAPFVGQVFPQFAFDPSFDLALAVMAFTGGLGTVIGPSLGALVIASAQQYFLLQFGGANVFLIAYGLLFILILRLLPGGVVPALTAQWRRWVVRRERRRDESKLSPPSAPEERETTIQEITSKP
jgi:branched-chain amino acid transport system permease protein